MIDKQLTLPAGIRRSLSWEAWGGEREREGESGGSESHSTLEQGKGGMETQDNRISVWVCQEEKLISGLSRRTTCADVIAALLEEAGLSQLLSGAPDTYCLVEKWRGFERTLPNKTKILRLWTAWGEEQDKVTFVLEKTRAALGRPGARSAQAKVVPSKDNPCQLRGAAGAALTMSRDKQRRVVRKAFRKLAKMNRSKRRESGAKEKRCRERMETLVHLVLSQDHTIRQQLERIRELDRDIDLCEARIHLDRMRKHGANYVQDTYLDGGSAPSRDGGEAEGEADEAAAEEGEPGQGDGAELEPDTLRDQLRTSLRIGLRLSSELEACGRELERCRSLKQGKRDELQRLLGELRESPRAVSPQTPAQTPAGCLAADEDSDTGLSSMNSQDSDVAPVSVSESLV
ncbi:ras association domain-containing protein 10 [Pristis pectinata]|uniref:ras association domain-containing protein 10 n=1 Tax=Pristis pectinata TaxID=685728 RepID=UPI00223E3769|nr:ras association domain-containing protein 10 [Pristis pectinata]